MDKGPKHRNQKHKSSNAPGPEGGHTSKRAPPQSNICPVLLRDGCCRYFCKRQIRCMCIRFSVACLYPPLLQQNLSRSMSMIIVYVHTSVAVTTIPSLGLQTPIFDTCISEVSEGAARQCGKQMGEGVFTNDCSYPMRPRNECQKRQRLSIHEKWRRAKTCTIQ